MPGSARPGGAPRQPAHFLAPRHHPLWMAFGRWFAPRYMRYYLKITRVELPPADAAIIERLRGERVILAPNHPTLDPPVVFHVGSLTGMHYYWMAARDIFDNYLYGWAVSHLGAYAVDPGAHDAEALALTRRLLAGGRHWLVVFPEGSNDFLHDELLPFLPGAARLGLKTLREIESTARRRPPVYILPLALRYYYVADMRKVMRASLAKLERRLGLERAPEPGWRKRLARIAGAVVAAGEAQYGLTCRPGEDLPRRVERVRDVLLQRAAAQLGAPVPAVNRPPHSRLRKLLNIADTMILAPGGSAAGPSMTAQRRRLRRLRPRLKRLAERAVISDVFSYDTSTMDNYLDALGRFELDVCGRMRFWGPRGVAVRAGAPIDLREHYGSFRDSPDETCLRVTAELERSVRDLLAQTSHLLTPLPAD